MDHFDWGMVCWSMNHFNWCMDHWMVSWSSMNYRGSMINWSSMIGWSSMIDWCCMISRGGMINWSCMICWGSVVSWDSMISWGSVIHWSCSMISHRSSMVDRTGGMSGMVNGSDWFLNCAISVDLMRRSVRLARDDGVQSSVRFMDRMTHCRGISMLDGLVMRFITNCQR